MTTIRESKIQHENVDEAKERLVDENETNQKETSMEIDENKIPEVQSFEGNLLGAEEKLPEFEFGGYIKLASNKPIYGVEFCNCLRSDEIVIFATVGANNVTIFECTDYEMKILQTYVDPDEEEIFLTCCWTYSTNTLHAILAFGGVRGIIKLIHPMSLLTSQILIGHCAAIHDLKVHPKDSSILLSVSRDHTLRLWNIESAVCIAIFGGSDGHTDQIVSADFDSNGNKIVSGGGDYAMKIWHLDKLPIRKLIQSSFSAPDVSDCPFRAAKIYSPEFTTRNIHNNIVDCVKWFGCGILSKATEDEIICWKPDTVSKYSKMNCAYVIHRFKVDKCHYWFIRFALDSAKRYMALGNDIGDIYVWSLNNEDPTKSTILRHEACKKIVRQIAFSADGRILIGVTDDSTIFRWNMK